MRFSTYRRHDPEMNAWELFDLRTSKAGDVCAHCHCRVWFDDGEEVFVDRTGGFECSSAPDGWHEEE